VWRPKRATSPPRNHVPDSRGGWLLPDDPSGLDRRRSRYS
jgi:hypothetical protein